MEKRYWRNVIFCSLFPLFVLLLSYTLVLSFCPLTPDQNKVMHFLQGKEELTLDFTAGELEHLQDVKTVMQGVTMAGYSLFIVVAGVLWLYRQEKKQLLKLAWYGGISTISVTLLFLLLTFVSFDFVFTLFHQLFFPQGNWIFPADSLLIQTFPLEFFVGISTWIFLLSLSIGSLFILVSFFYERYVQKFIKKKALVSPMKEEVSRWLAQARSDLTAASHSISSQDYDWACFQAQQAAEKALKGLLLHKESKIIKTHDLLFLSDKVNLPEHLKSACKELTFIYIHVRYPDTAEIKDLKGKARRYLSAVGEIIQWTEKQLSEN